MTTLLIVSVLASVAGLIIANTTYRLFKLNQQQTAKIADLQSQLSALCAAAVGSDDKFAKFERSLNQLKEHQNTLDLGMANQHSYDHAIRLARKGAGMNQLMDNCNISDEEAHLINRLHGAETQLKQDIH